MRDRGQSQESFSRRRYNHECSFKVGSVNLATNKSSAGNDSARARISTVSVDSCTTVKNTDSLYIANYNGSSNGGHYDSLVWYGLVVKPVYREGKIYYYYVHMCDCIMHALQPLAFMYLACCCLCKLFQRCICPQKRVQMLPIKIFVDHLCQYYKDGAASTMRRQLMR